MSSSHAFRQVLAIATILSTASLHSVRAADPAATLQDVAVPPFPTPGAVDVAAGRLAAPIDTPITGATTMPDIVGDDAPPSLEALQASRPGFNPDKGLSGLRGEALRQSAISFGARWGLAARSFALNEMLRRYEAQLDSTYDFRSLVLPVGGGQTLMRPPVVTEAQMAFALGDGGQIARESGHVYEITREASLASAPPNWRTYLVRSWAKPTPPPDDLRPRSDEEVIYWDKWVAEGWADGEKQAVEIFLSDLGRLERDMVGMARYRVLLRAGLVEAPEVTFSHRSVDGGRDQMRVGDTQIRIKNQPGLDPNRRHWTGGTTDLPSKDGGGPLRLTP